MVLSGGGEGWHGSSSGGQLELWELPAAGAAAAAAAETAAGAKGGVIRGVSLTTLRLAGASALALDLNHQAINHGDGHFENAGELCWLWFGCRLVCVFGESERSCRVVRGRWKEQNRRRGTLGGWYLYLRWGRLTLTQSSGPRTRGTEGIDNPPPPFFHLQLPANKRAALSQPPRHSPASPVTPVPCT